MLDEAWADREPPAGDEPAPSTGPVFEARGITKTYGMGDVLVHALRGVDMDRHAGEFAVLLGPSGSGKSTLLNRRETVAETALRGLDQIGGA